MFYIAVVGLLGLALVLRSRLQQGHPGPWFVGGWGGLLLAHALLPVAITPINSATLYVVLCGATAFGVGALSRHRAPPSETNRAYTVRSRHGPFLVVALVTSGAVLYGLFSFQHHIVALTAGSSFSSLSATEVRAAMSSSAGQHGGLGTLLFALAPLLACLGEYGGRRYSRAYYLLIPLALWASTHSPGRTLTLQVTVCLVVFSLYDRKLWQRAFETTIRLNRLAVVAVAAILVAGAIIYFNAVGRSLNKNDLYEAQLNHGWVPQALITPVTYQEGGLSALSVATTERFDPTAGNHGRSIYLVARAAKFLGFIESTPETVASNVSIPIPFNVYTGFGDLWFDFGYLGLAIVMLFVGRLSSSLHARSVEGDMSAAWISTVLWGVLASMAVSFRLFTVETAALALAGIIALKILSHRNRQSGVPRFSIYARERAVASN